MPGDRHFTRDGATIAYQYSGRGRPLGYAHGVFLSRDAVRRMGLFDFDALSAGRSLFTYDQRGHGPAAARADPRLTAAHRGIRRTSGRGPR
ncbi:alpha/beta fold hydrolase [Kibdelosporangium phytohabitans]|uniref:AB hydrolase-1 domain-containing protein n=1 Tax=Kibdelosporangium phytohabitans TaxID=860235 RepID=A0A0N9I999_9PSEU|nr:hypothetical protein [Kibdelosporangium phytohabitans]ALG12537.1 hypothetical protein AOZ06_41805 [Kibdelosporangium phytohabitans]MBE1464142.1 pimeloyl-ACP methyl ester carboxylesterase [Kibdelosporangium phytohabitans]